MNIFPSRSVEARGPPCIAIDETSTAGCAAHQSRGESWIAGAVRRCWREAVLSRPAYVSPRAVSTSTMDRTVCRTDYWWIRLRNSPPRGSNTMTDICTGKTVGIIVGDHIEQKCEQPNNLAATLWQQRMDECIAGHRDNPVNEAPKDAIVSACKRFIAMPPAEAAKMERTLFGNK
jgi:hypothetical protein